MRGILDMDNHRFATFLLELRDAATLRAWLSNGREMNEERDGTIDAAARLGDGGCS
jgi:hypothetical protein